MKRNLAYLFALLAIGALSLVACQKQFALEETDSDEEIVFTVDGLDSVMGVETKATAVTTANLTEFYAAATRGSAGSETSSWTSYHYSGTSGGTFRGDAPRKWWPLNNPSYHFYASNLTLTFAAAGTTVAATTATDVVCAYLPSPTFCESNPLTFNHVFARIGNFTVTAAEGYTISNATITITPKTSGTYNLRTGNGQTNGTGWSSTSNGSATNLISSFSTITHGTSSASSTTSNDLYLIPGTYTLTATWTATRGDYTETFSSKQVNVAITGGKINAISTTLGGLAEEIVFTVAVTAWGSSNVSATFPTS